MKKKNYIIFAVILMLIGLAVFMFVRKANAPVNNSQPITNNLQQIENSNPNPESIDNIQPPITSGPEKTLSQTINPLPNALERITKKPFGILINPKTSPVQPERFSGYHNAVDLEITPAEQNISVPVKALCDGKFLIARTAVGYGGVAVQSCVIDGQAVTVVYGHISLASIRVQPGEQLSAGNFLANLGEGYSRETEGERKHLHLGIHEGAGVNISGYVQSEAALADWIDPVPYLTK